MASISNEEDKIIRQMFLGKASESDLKIIMECVLEVKEGRGIHKEVVRNGANLFGLKSSVVDILGISQSTAGILSTILWHLVSSTIERSKQESAGITHAHWIYSDYLCKHESHAKLNGKKFPLKKGVRNGLFKRINAGELVGCGCMVKPIIP